VVNVAACLPESVQPAARKALAEIRTPRTAPTRARLTTHVEQEIDIYLYRIREQPTQKV
jgi:hypothetical protein